MVLWLELNLAETTSVWPPQGGGHSRSPTLQKLPRYKRNTKWQEARRAGNRGSEKRTQQKAHAAQPQIPEDLRLRQEVLAPMAGGTYA